MKTFQELIEKQKKINEKEILYKTKKGKEGFFVVTARNTTGMPGQQDKFSMYIIDEVGKIIKDLGSHPSLGGSKIFAKARGYLKIK